MWWIEEIALLNEERCCALQSFKFVTCTWDEHAKQVFEDGGVNSAEVGDLVEPVGEQMFTKDTPEVVEGQAL